MKFIDLLHLMVELLLEENLGEVHRSIGPDPHSNCSQAEIRIEEVFAVAIWHAHNAAKVYRDVVVQVSDDPDFIEGVKTVFNNDFDNSSGLGLGKNLEFIDDYRGKLIDAKTPGGEPVKGRYVRLYSKGNTSNDMNHYVEVEVFGKPAK